MRYLFKFKTTMNGYDSKRYYTTERKAREAIHKLKRNGQVVKDMFKRVDDKWIHADC